MHTLYRFYAHDGTLLYIGITNNPPRRFSKHRDEKTWWLNVARIHLEQHPSREALRAAEKIAIKTERPLHNVRMNTGTTQRSAPVTGPTWTFDSRRYAHTKTGQRMSLWWEVDGSSLSDDFYYEEADEFELLQLWYRRYMPANELYRLPDGHAPIFWYVQFTHGFEGAPYCEMSERLAEKHTKANDGFLHYFTWPINEQTGDPINWLELPVDDKRWSQQHTNKGGFIQEALQWKPAPLQPSIDVVRLAKAARVSL